jgi:hypothetical protein
MRILNYRCAALTAVALLVMAAAAPAQCRNGRCGVSVAAPTQYYVAPPPVVLPFRLPATPPGCTASTWAPVAVSTAGCTVSAAPSCSASGKTLSQLLESEPISRPQHAADEGAPKPAQAEGKPTSAKPVSGAAGVFNVRSGPRGDLLEILPAARAWVAEWRPAPDPRFANLWLGSRQVGSWNYETCEYRSLEETERGDVWGPAEKYPPVGAPPKSAVDLARAEAARAATFSREFAAAGK